LDKALTIPSNLVQILRAALITELGNAASAIAGFSEPDDDAGPEDLSDLLEEFDAHRAILEAIGLEQEGEHGPVEVDIDVHGDVLRAALESELAVRRDFLDVDPSFEGAAQQRERAARDVRALEASLADLDDHE